MKFEAIDSKILFLNIAQIVSNGAGEWPADFHREAIVQVSKNSGEHISHITVEFYGKRAKYLCVGLFDGSGDNGTSIHKFAMPGVKLNLRQKALLGMSLVEYLIGVKAIKSDFEYIKESFAIDVEGGSSNILNRYDEVCNASFKLLEDLNFGLAMTAEEFERVQLPKMVASY